MFDLNSFFENPDTIFHLNSKIPQTCLSTEVIVGIDEAGRGPVLGPMVYSAAFCPLSIQKHIEKEKFQDSKTLSEKQRNEMFKTIDNYGSIGWFTAILSPIVISNSMLKRAKYNLNELSHDTAISLIRNLLDKGINIKEVYVDTVGIPEKYELKLKKIFPQINKIKVAKQADSMYKIVSIASICAKVIRDYIIKYWKFRENLPYNEEDYGSGYPSDPKTKEFLSNAFNPIFGFPTFVRFSWSTVTKIMAEKAIPCKWDDDEDDDGNNGNGNKNNSIKDFFKTQKNSNKINLKSSNFFTSRDIEQITDLDQIFN